MLCRVGDEVPEFIIFLNVRKNVNLHSLSLQFSHSKT